MGNKKEKKEGEDNSKILKIPVNFNDFKLKVTSGETLISFAIQPEHLDLAKPLFNCPGEPYVLLLYKMADKDDLDGMVGIGLEDHSLEEL